MVGYRNQSQTAQLVCLNIGRNNLSGSLPASVGDCKRLQKLWLNENQLVGEIPPAIGQCTELELLNLCGNEGITGAIPASLGQCARLIDLQLHGTALSHCPDELLQCTELVKAGLTAGQGLTLPLENGINNPAGLNAKGKGKVNFWVHSAPNSPSPGTRAVADEGSGCSAMNPKVLSKIRSGRMAGGSGQ